MKLKPKFKAGDFVRHRASENNESNKLLVAASAVLKFEESEAVVYLVSALNIPHIGSFRTYLDEAEIELFNN